MPGGRRNAKSSSFKHHAHSSEDRHACEMPTHPEVIPPKHIPVPDLPAPSDLYFELDSLIFCLLAMAGQYINLYRSVFWLPHSHTDYALNYYLIDLNVLIISLIMVGRRLPVCILKQICCFCLPPLYHSSCPFYIQVFTAISFLPVIAYCVYNIIFDHGIFTIIILMYPAIVFLIAFGANALKFLELKPVIQEKNTGARSKNVPVNKNPGSVTHVCSMSAEIIREEVGVLKNDFNARLKQVIFNSLLVTYYTAFLPCYFAQTSLYYDVKWAIQHAVFTGIGCFTLYVTHCFPARYCDVLHRAALHLGHWQKVEIKNVHIPYSIWSESTTWNQGALVKYSKELFKAEGISNAAEPGHSAHSKFYALFKNPSRPIKYLWVIQILLLFSQMAVLFQSYKWNDVLSIQLLILMNCKTLYSITKVYFVVRKIYYEETLLISKFNN